MSIGERLADLSVTGAYGPFFTCCLLCLALVLVGAGGVLRACLRPLVHAARFFMEREYVLMIEQEKYTDRHEERYLWIFTFEMHKRWYLWCGYFLDDYEANAFVEMLLHNIPCMRVLWLGERAAGQNLFSGFYQYLYSEMQRAESAFEKPLHKRDRRLFPVAPLFCDHLTSLMSRIARSRYCPRCEQGWFALEQHTTLPPYRLRQTNGTRHSTNHHPPKMPLALVPRAGQASSPATCRSGFNEHN